MAELKLPPLIINHPAKTKDIRNFWDQRCSKILADSRLPEKEQTNVVLQWWEKAGVKNFMLGKMVAGWARPKRPPLSEEKKKERERLKFERYGYTTAGVPYLRAFVSSVSERIEALPGDTAATLAVIDSREGDPEAAFAAFSKSIEQKVLLEYRPSPTQSLSADAAE